MKRLRSTCTRRPTSMRRPQSAQKRGWLVVALVALAAASLDATYAASDAGSAAVDSDVVVLPPIDSNVTRIPIDIAAEAYLNGSAGSSASSSDGNDTITFESVSVGEDTISKHDEPQSTTVTPPRTISPLSLPAKKQGTRETEDKSTINPTDLDADKLKEAERKPIEIDDPTLVVSELAVSADREKGEAASPKPSLTALSSSSSSSDGATVGTPTPTLEIHGVPSNPTMVTAVAFDGRAEVSWKAPDDDGFDPITEYEVAWIDGESNLVVGTLVVTHIPGSVISGIDASSAPASVPTNVIVRQLLNGRSYNFKVRAKNKNGFSVWSAKSLAVSPLHPPDLCERVSCSGHGTCFPYYHPDTVDARRARRSLLSVTDNDIGVADGRCICRPGYSPPDCSVKTDTTKFVWKVGEWGECSSGCGGGKRTREATCIEVATEKPAASEGSCTDKKPSLTRICNGMECGSKLVSIAYEVEMSYDEVLFSPEAWDAFELAFTTEVSAALQIQRTRIEVTAIKRGSIAVYFQILPASRVGEKSLNDIVELLQEELSNSTSTLRSKGTFARRIESNGVKLSFSLADQTVAGGVGDISIIGLFGTVFVLCSFVAMFGWFLRKRHERIIKYKVERGELPETVLVGSRSEMKRMGIRTMA
ncbi:hypothetical protein Poli38472_004183 [Pythium oligandrum]|uniref:Fibronectin type-III domain-containing protein n=1 Tax=Pythium oligandrum TaxID=41045 RepID=A0A8K1FQA7_PYTOL|nr:hypothetical protein Poli38472_004183 [Pythium oligandrum]|eukprot:TMW66418.1 hypothetical protein Poli38472_004183 [Pythium oligandrum]